MRRLHRKATGALQTAKGALEIENTRPCGLLKNLQMQYGLLLSQTHFLIEEQKHQVKEYTRLTRNHLRFRQDSIESRHEKKVTEQDIVFIAAKIFDRMVRLTVWLAGRGLALIDDEYKGFASSPSTISDSTSKTSTRDMWTKPM